MTPFSMECSPSEMIDMQFMEGYLLAALRSSCSSLAFNSSKPRCRVVSGYTRLRRSGAL